MAETTDLLGIKNLCRFWHIIKTHLGLKVDKVSGKGLSTNDFTTAEKDKLAGIAAGAEVNQNAFSNVVVGSTTVSADAKTDTLTLVAGSNVTLTPDATNDKVTIAATDTKYTPASADPLMDGTVAVGTSTKYAREDHRHPTDTSRAATSHKHAWNTLVTTHNNTQANFTNPRNTYSELLIVAYFPDLNDTTKNKYFTTVVPTSALSSSVLEVWVGGGRGDSTNGYANSGARAVCNLTQTYIKGVAASESSNNRLSATTWIVYAR